MPVTEELTAWRRQHDGSHTETAHRSSTIEPITLPGVTIGIERLLD